MSKRHRIFSGAGIISVLAKHFDFSVVSQKGSHVKLKHVDGRVTIVPLHKELAPGTLASVLRLARIDRSDFLDAFDL